MSNSKNITTTQQIETLTVNYGSFAVSLMSDAEMQQNIKAIKAGTLQTLKDKNSRSNICSLIIDKLKLKLDKDVSVDLPIIDVANIIAIDNQNTFFTLSKDGNEINVPNLVKETREGLLNMVIAKQIEATVISNAKPVKAAINATEKLKVALGLWFNRSFAIIREVSHDNSKSLQHAKCANLLELGFVLTISEDKKTITFTGA
jgi:hypothetical protein